MSAAVAARGRTPFTIDDEFVAIARDVPGFAGLSFDSAGVMTVYVTDLVQSDFAIAAASDAVRDRQGWSPTRSRVKLVRYGFAQLEDWMDRLIQSSDLPRTAGFVYIDANEVTNRVEIGVEDTSQVALFEDLAAAAGIPRDALGFRQTPRLRLASTLRDSVRPTRAGLQVGIQRSPVQVAECTLGPSARFSGSATNYFLVNSHCTKSIGLNDHGVAHQKASFSTGTIIGDEFSDPPFLPAYNNDPRCPPGYKCRYSDAALFTYRSGVSVYPGNIARTKCRNCVDTLSRITIDPANPVFRINQVGDYPYAGQWLNKMGMMTGWTYGDVFSSCLSFAEPDTTGLWVMCQYGVEGDATGGDSGSPYFELDANDNALLEGMMFAYGSDRTYGVLSPMGGIWFDLGSNLIFTP